jgi:signal transduction histidine kinase
MGKMLLPTLSTMSTERVKRHETHEFSVPANRILPTVSAALLVGIGYYVGTRIGFAWTPSGQPNSTFWPPNAILLAALLLTPRREWWTFFVAVLPAHMFAQLQTGVPVLTAFGWFITNSIEALIGAYCITKFTDPGKRLYGVRGVLIFVVFGVLFAPLATSFLDAAAVVITGWGRDYWHLGWERFWTNALAALTIVPIIVLCSPRDISRIRKVNIARWGEVALLTLGTVVVAFLVFGLQDVSPATTPALLYVPLPFLLWAAARFGVAGLSLSLLSLALTSTWFTMHGREPFPYASLPQNILSLQILLCVVALPLMFLSAVMAEAQRTQESLRKISGSLIDAQEQERHRIARDLHDGLGQELALVNVMLDKLRDESDASLQLGLSDLSSRVLAIAETTRELSHGLFPTHLEYLGLQKAMRKLCNEVQRGKEISLHLSIGNLPDKLQPSTSLSLYRVVQETLHNIITHSHAKNVKVELASDDGQILLRIIDDGVGFDVSQEGTGLGLASMRQRVQALGGSIDISSSPRAGAQIEVRVPFRESCSDDVSGAA